MQLTLADAVLVASRMRQEDRDCLEAFAGACNAEGFAVNRWQTDGAAWALLADGEPVAMFGLSRINPWSLNAWLVATPAMTHQSWKKLLRHCRTVRDNALKSQRRIECSVLSTWPRAIRFAESLGFQLEGVKRVAGKGGEDKATRDLRFELFAKGLNGGSEDINQTALLGRTYDQGVLDLGAKADAAAADLRAKDESTRLGLLQSIDSGVDQTSALSSATNQLANNGAAASATAQGTSIGDLFADVGLLNTKSQYSQGKAAGTDWWNSLTPSGSFSTTGSRKAASGTISAS